MSGQEETMAVILKTTDEINQMQQAGKVAADLLSVLKAHAVREVTTQELDALAADYLKNHGATSALLHRRGWPAYTCISLNDEILNGLPSKYRLRTGDVLKFEVGVTLNHWCALASLTVPVGQIGGETQRLLQTTERALSQGIAAARAGNRVQDISKAIQQPVEAAGFSVVRNFGGSGIGRGLHEDPHVLGYVEPGQPNLVLQPGMVLHIVAIVNAGSATYEPGGEGIFTADRSISAMFGQTIAITKAEPDVLTR
jgi:methionyl aminopeptidase